jgi:hypothetical protein
MQAALKHSYGFDLVIAVPRDAHNSMCSAETHGQQCSASDMLTQQQFDDGVAAFAAVNMSLVLYTSVRCYAYHSQWPTRANSNTFNLCSLVKQSPKCISMWPAHSHRTNDTQAITCAFSVGFTGQAILKYISTWP